MPPDRKETALSGTVRNYRLNLRSHLGMKLAS